MVANGPTCAADRNDADPGKLSRRIQETEMRDSALLDAGVASGTAV